MITPRHRPPRRRRAGLVGLLLAVALLSRPGAAQAPPTETLVFLSVADTYVSADAPTRNFNGEARLRADASPANVGYLRFSVSGLDGRPVLQARLQLGVISASAESSGRIHRITAGSWSETTVTYATRPAIDGPALDTQGPFPVGAVVEFNVVGTVTGDGAYDFALDSLSGDSVSYATREAASGHKPTLVLTVGSSSHPRVEIIQPPDGARFFAGDPITLQATASDAVDGDLGALVQWQSSLDGPLGAGAAITRTLSQGSHTVTASVTDQDGFRGQDQVGLAIVPPPPPNTAPLVAITSPIDGRTFTRGEPVPLQGTASDQEDGDLTSRLAWTSDRDGALGGGGSTPTSLTQGTHRITASVTDSGGLSGSAMVTANVVAPTTLEFTPIADGYVDSGSASTNRGTSPQLVIDASPIRIAYLRFLVNGVGSRRVTQAILRLQVDTASGSDSDQGGAVRAISSNAWQETTVTYANRPALDGPMLASAGAVARGQTVDLDVTAAVSGDRTYNFALTTPSSNVANYRARESATPPKLILLLSGNAPAVTISTPASGAVAMAGTPVTFTASATDVEDGPLGAQLQWTSSLDGWLGTGASFSTSTLGIGTHTITAAVTDSAGQTGQAQVTLRVRGPNAPPVVTVVAPGNGTRAPAGTPVTLSAMAADDFDGDLSSQLHWTSSRGDPLGTGSSRTVRLSEGTHTLTAAVTDSDGASASAAITFTVTPSPPVVTITTPAADVAVFVGTPVTMGGTATDATDGSLSGALRWTSDLDGPLDTGATVTISSLSPGTHVITAAVTDSGGLTGQARRTLQVRFHNAAPTVTITSPLDTEGYLTGEVVRLAAQASDAEDGDLSGAVRWSSSRSGVLGTGAALEVATLPAGTHVLTAAVTDADGASTSASVTISVTGNTLTFVPVADAYLDAPAPTANFGTASTLRIDGSPVQQTLLRFAVSGLGSFAVERARLRLTVSTVSGSPSDRGGTVHRITNDAWTEVGVTYNTRPALDGPALGSAGEVLAGATVDFDVTAGLTGEGRVNFALVSPSTNAAIYQSREASSGRPQLVVTLKRNQPPTVAITAPPGGTTLAAGTAVTLAGRATDAETGDLSSQIRWSSDRDGVLGTGASLSVPGLTPGAHVLTARATDASGAEGHAEVGITVGNPPVVRIAGPSDQAVVFTSDLPLTLHGTATDAEDGDLAGSMRWTSSRDGALGTGASVSAAHLSLGMHTLAASVADAAGQTGRAEVTVRVRAPNAAPTLAVTAPASGSSVAVGTAVAFAGTASDDFDRDVSGQIRWSSSRDGALGTGASVAAAALSLGSHTITAAVTDSDGLTTSAEIALTVTAAPPVVTIVAPPDGARVFAGESLAFSGTALVPSEGDVSAGLRWTSDRDGLIGTGPSFATSALGVGTHTVTAAATSSSLLTGEARRTVVVRPPNLPPALVIDAPVAGWTLLAGKPLLLVARAADAEDGDLAARVGWASSLDGALGSGSPLVVTGLRAGTHMLTASVTDRDGGTVSASVSLTLRPTTLIFLPIADTCVDSSSPSAGFGGAATLAADASPVKETYLRFVLTDVDPFGVGRATLRLTTGSSSVAASSAGGDVHGISDNNWSEGTTTYANRPAVDGRTLARAGAVSAGRGVDFDVTGGVFANGTYNFALVTTSSDDVVYQSREATTGRPQLIVDLTQDTAPVVRITAPASGLRVNPGASVSLAATASDAESGDLSSGIEWSSSLDGPLGSGAALAVTLLSEGTHTITARATDVGGGIGEDRVVVHVGHRPVMRITTPADHAVVFADELPVDLAATATDVEDGDLRAALSWTSSLDGVLGTGPLVTATLRIGTHTITAAASDSTGLRGEGRITLRVRGPNLAPEAAITAPADGTAIPAGTALTLAGIASDDFDGNLTHQIRWTSSREGLLGTGGTLSVRLGEGSHTITAAVVDSNGASGAAHVSVTVTPSAPVVTIAAPPEGTRVFTGTAVTFGGTALDATDGDLSGVLRWTSDRDGPIGSGPTFTTAALGIGTHAITAAVSDSGGLSGQARRTVVVRPPNTPPILALQSPGDGAALLAGKPVLLAATALDGEDGDLSAAVRWTSSRDGLLGTGAALVVPTLSAGAHTLTATVTDRDGAEVSAAVAVTLSASTLTFLPTADTYVDAGSATTRFGTASSLAADASPVKQAFLRFAVSGIGTFMVDRATLRLTTTSSSAASSGVGGELHTITNSTWSEASTTYNTRPAVDGPTVASRGAVTANALVDFDVRPAITADGTYNFALITTSSDDVIYQTREASAGKPQLVVILKQNTAPVVHITAPRSGTVANVGEAVTLQGRAADAEGGDLSGTIAWRSSLDGPLGGGAARTLSTLRPGIHTITARVSDASGVSGGATIVLQVGHTPTVAITAPRAGAIVYTRELPITLRGTATDVEDGDLASRLGWTSSLDGALGTGAAVSAGTLHIGTHTLTAAVTDTHGQTGQATVTVRVRGDNEAPALAIVAPPSGAAVPAGTVVTVSGTVTDDFDGDLRDRIRWSSSRDGNLGAGATRTFVPSEGSHTISAAVSDSDGVSADAQVTLTVVPTPPAVTIAAPGAGSMPLVGTGVTFTGTAVDATDGDLSASLRWVSDRDGEIGTGGTFSTSVLALGAHTISAEVADAGGLIGRAQVAITVIRLPEVTILVPEPGSGFLTTTAVTFFGTAGDVVDGDVSAGLTWTSDVDGPLGTGPAFTTGALSPGVHTVTAQATNTDGRHGIAQVTFTVHPNSLAFQPVADTYVDAGSASTKFGAATEITADASPVRQSFLRFEVTGVTPFPVLRARLELTAGSDATAASVSGGRLHRISSNAWSEATTTYGTRPAIDGPVLASLDAGVAASEVVSLDVSPVVTGDGTYNFALVSSNADQVKYASREASTGRPALVLELGQPSAQQPPRITITAPAPEATLLDDEPVTMRASATDAEDGDLGAAVVWSSSLEGSLGTGAAVTRHLRRGTHALVASVRDSFGLSASAAVTVHVVDRPPTVAIAEPGDGILLPVAFPITLSGTAVDAQDGDLAPGLVWTSDRDGTLGAGGSVVLAGLTPGDHRITASVTNSAGTPGGAAITLFVGTAPPQVGISAPAAGSVVSEGMPLALVGVAHDIEDGDLSAGLAWSSDAEGPLGTGASLPVTLTARGRHRIRAAVTDSHGFTRAAEIELTVTPAPPLVTIVAPADGAAFSGPVTLRATAVDLRDGTVSPSIRWTTSAGDVLGTGATITVASLAGGRQVVVARATDRDGLTGEARVAIVIGNTAPRIIITEPASGATVPSGRSVRFSATATDTADGNLTPGLRWFSSLNGAIGAGATFTTSGLARGTHLVTARATDSRGLTGSAEVVVQVTAATSNQPPRVTITAPASGTSTVAGVPVTFAATALDDFEGNLSGRVTWVSDIDGVIGTGTPVTTTALSPGTHAVSAMVADSSGNYGSAQLVLLVGQPALVLEALADAYTDASAPNTNFGTATTLQGDASPIRQLYLRFAVSGLQDPVQSAVVRLQTGSDSASGSDVGGELHTVSDGAWSELTITHANKPALDGAPLAVVGAVGASQPVDFDVSRALDGDGTYDFGVRTPSVDLVKYGAREAATGRPQLVVVPSASGIARPVVHVTAPLDLASLPQGAEVTLTASATDAQDGDVGATIVWRSHRDGVLGTGPSLVRTLSAGAHVITATATDVDGHPGTDRVRVSAHDDAVAVRIEAPVAGAVLPADQPVTFIGTASALEDGDVSFALRWTSSLDGPLGTGAGFTRTLSPGTHTITAAVTDSDGKPGSATAPVQVGATDLGFRDWVFGAGVGVGGHEATAQKPESKLWHHDGIWWASLYSPASGVRAHRIHRLDRATQRWIDTGVLVDDRGPSRQEILPEGDTLWVASRFGYWGAGASGVPNPRLQGAQNRLLRYTYHAGAQTWALDAGFPADIPGGGTEAIGLARDSTGRLWIAYTLDGKVWVSHTLGSDTRWAAPFVVPVAAGTTVSPDDIATVIALPGRIGIFWSNQLTETDYFAVHDAAASPADAAAWTLEVVGSGSSFADDHFNLKVASDGHVYAAVKTSRSAAASVLVGLVVRSPAGVWSPLHLVSEAAANATRPICQLDERARRVYVFYSLDQRAIHYKTSDIDAIAFPSGPGTPFITSSTIGDINDPTGTRQTVDASTGIVVEASSNGNNSYWHNTIDPLSRPLVAIASPLDGVRVATGTAVDFAATAVSPVDGLVTGTLGWLSSLDGALGAGGSFTRADLTAGAHLITAEVTDSSGVKGMATIALTVEPDAPPVVTIVAPAATRVLAGRPIAFTGTALDSLDGDLAADLVWTSSRDGQLGTGGAFTRADLSVGTHTVTAAVADRAGLLGSRTITLEIQASAPPSVTVTAPRDGRTFAFGTPVIFAGTASDPLDGDLTGGLAWSSSRDGALGTGGGFARANLSKGVHSITARVTDGEGLTASAATTITVADEAPPVVAITAPAAPLVGDVLPVTFGGTAIDAVDGDRSDALVWTSSRDGIIGNGPSVTSGTLGLGVHRITAAATDTGGRLGTAEITLEVRHQPPPAVAITAPADEAIVLAGDDVRFAATASDTVDGDLGAALRWTSDRDGALGTGAAVTARLSAGRHTITASATNSGALTGSAEMRLTAHARPEVIILAPADATLVPHGDLVTLTAVALDFEDGELTGDVTWTSSRDGALGTGGSVTVLLSRGAHTITAAVRDSHGDTGTAGIALDVNARPAVVITGPASGALFRVGEAVALAALANDAEDGDLGASIAWGSDLAGPLGTGGSLTVTHLASGTHTLSAQVADSRGLTSVQQVTVVVNDPPEVTITSPADGALVVEEDALELRATATDREDGDLDAAIAWSSERSGPLGSGPSLGVTTLTPGVHVITATVADGGGRTDTELRTITVAGRPRVTITAPISGTRVDFGQGVTLTATAADFEDGDLTGAIAWTSLRDGALGAGGTLMVSTLTPGVHTITAAVTDASGIVALTETILVVNAPPAVAITAPAAGADLERGAVVFRATALDLEDGDLGVRIAWHSSLDGALGTGATITVETLRSGTHTITAAVSDDDGLGASAAITIVVNASPAIAIAAPADGAVFSPGDPIVLAGTASDFEDGDLAAAIVWTSDLDGSLGTGSPLGPTGLRSGTHTVTATVIDAGGKQAAAEIRLVVNAAPSVEITAPADGAVFSPGEPIAFAATADDREDDSLAAAVVWTSDRDGALGTGSPLVRALGSGTHVITAAVADSGGKQASARITLVVNAAPELAITGPADGAVFSPGEPITFSATATDAEDVDLGAAVAWTSDLAGSLGTGTPLVRPLGSGTHRITATVTDGGGKHATAALTVVVNAAPTLAVTAPADGAILLPAEAVTLVATATDAEDGDLGATIVWTSGRDGALGTGSPLTVASLGLGTHVVTAEVVDGGGKRASGRITLVVNAAPSVAIAAPADGTVFSPGDAVELAATASDLEDGDLAGAIVWTSDRDGALGTGTPLTVGTLTSGMHTLSATVADRLGTRAGAQVTVVVNAAPTVAIVAPADGALFSPGATVELAGTADDVEDGDLSGAIVWTSDLDGVLGTGTPLDLTTLSSGIHTITAAVTDVGGKRARAHITVVVNAAPTVAIVTPADGALFSPGATVTLAGIAADLEDGNLAGGIAWTSDRDGRLGTGTPLLVGTLTSGVHTITATVTDGGGRPASAQITVVVNAAPRVAITSPANGAKFSPGNTIEFTGTASDTEDGDLAGAIVWSSDLDGLLGTGSPLATRRLRSGRHTITATVTDAGGRSASVQHTLTVNAAPTLAVFTPADNSLFSPGATITFTGTAADLEDGNLSDAIVWRSNLDGVFGTGTPLGFDGMTSGTHIITATVTDSLGKSATATRRVFVNAAPSVAIVTPAEGAVFAPGETIVFTGTASDLEDGNLASAIGWSSSRDGTLGSGESLAVGTLSSGTHTITATVLDSGGREARATRTVVVNARPTVAITAPTNGTLVQRGDTLILVGTASDLEDGDLAAAIVWSSSYDGALGAGSTISLRTLRAGVHTITARVTDGGGRSADMSIQVVVNAAPTLTVVTPVSGSLFSPGETIGFTAAAGDAEDGDLGAAVVWTSDLAGGLGTGTPLGLATLPSGTHTITATVADSQGGSASAAITVVVNAAPALVITAPASGAVYSPGDLVVLTGTANDLEDGGLSGAIRWDSDLAGPLGMGTPLPVGTLDSGTHTITATVTDSGGRSTSASITVVVNAAPTVAIRVGFSGGVLRLIGTGSDREDGDVSSVIVWTSSLDGFLGTGSTINGSVLSIGTHVITAGVTDSGGKHASDQITVEILP